MDNERQQTKLIDMNEHIVNIISDLVRESSKAKIEGKTKQAFELLREIFYYVKPHKFKTKFKIEEITRMVENHAMSLQGKPMTEYAKIKMNENVFLFSDLVNQYSSLIISGLAELNLWLKVVKQYEDQDERFSFETFGTKKKLLDKKKEVLKEIPIDILLDLFDNDHVHNAHSRLLIQEVK